MVYRFFLISLIFIFPLARGLVISDPWTSNDGTSCGGDPNARSGCVSACNNKCSTIGKGIDVCTLACTSIDCICKSGFYKDDNLRKCVTKNQCTYCGDDVNATPGCGINCGRRCVDLYYSNVPCPRSCFDSCDCKSGTYFSQRFQKCVPPQFCYYL